MTRAQLRAAFERRWNPTWADTSREARRARFAAWQADIDALLQAHTKGNDMPKHLHQFIAIDKGSTDRVCAACEYLSAGDAVDGPHPICRVNQGRRDRFAAAYVAAVAGGNAGVVGAWEFADRMMAADKD